MAFGKDGGVSVVSMCGGYVLVSVCVLSFRYISECLLHAFVSARWCKSLPSMYFREQL